MSGSDYGDDFEDDVEHPESAEDGRGQPGDHAHGGAPQAKLYDKNLLPADMRDEQQRARDWAETHGHRHKKVHAQPQHVLEEQQHIAGQGGHAAPGDHPHGGALQAKLYDKNLLPADMRDERQRARDWAETHGHGDGGEVGEDEDATPDEALIAEVAAHRAAARTQHKEAAERSRAREDQGRHLRWGVRGPTMYPGKYKSEVDKRMEEARAKPGPGHYPAASSISPHRAARFNTGVRRERKIDDEEGSYLDPLNSTTLTKQGSVISPSNNARYFVDWDESEVGRWLARIGLGHLAQSFARQGVRGQDLADLKAEELQDLLGVRVFADRRRLVKEMSVLRGQLPTGTKLPDIGPGRYNANTDEIYEITGVRSDKGGVFNKGGPAPVQEDFVQKEAGEKPAPNAYTYIAERHQHFMSTRLGRAVKFSDGEPLTAVERRCRQIEDDPAPGTYEPRLPEPRHKGVKMSRAKRKDLWGSGDDVPGPGAYSGTGVQLHTIRCVSSRVRV